MRDFHFLSLDKIPVILSLLTIELQPNSDMIKYTLELHDDHQKRW